VPASQTPPPTSPRPRTPREYVARELALEDQQVLGPLTERIRELSDRLDEGKAVDPAYIEEGVELWSRYIRDVHGQRIRRLIGGAFPRATTYPQDSGARAHRLGGLHRGPSPSMASANTASADRFTEMEGLDDRMPERASALLGLVEAYRRNTFGARTLLASLLRSCAFSDRMWAQYEREFVRRYLDEPLAPAASQRLREALAEVGALRDKIAPEVKAYIAHPIPITAPPAGPSPPADRGPAARPTKAPG
jgi:hypothetical protein